MKRTIAILICIFTLTLAATAQSASSWLISKQQLRLQSLQPISGPQLASMIENARTPAQHQQIADYYRAQSLSLWAEWDQHARMRDDYVRNPAKGVRTMLDHCTFLMQDLRMKSKRAADLASEHERIAKEAQK